MLRKCGWILLAVAYAAPAAQTVAVNGTVFDRGTHLPVPNASVALRDNLTPGDNATATTDKDGAFHIDVDEPGAYSLVITADHYISSEFQTTQPSVRITKSELSDPKPEAHVVTIELAQAGTITGDLRDGTTQKPLSGFIVTPLRITWSRGKRQLSPQGQTKSGEDGSFRAEVPDGDYVVEISKLHEGNLIRVGREPDYSAKFQPKQDYPTVLWPAGELQVIVPLRVRAAAESSTGTIHMARVTMGRIRSALPVGVCPRDRSGNVSIGPVPARKGPLLAILQVPCGSAFTVSGLSPGEYVLSSATSGAIFGGVLSNSALNAAMTRQLSSVPSPHKASSQVQIEEGTDREVDLTFAEQQPLDIKRQCECADPQAVPLQEISYANNELVIQVFRRQTPTFISLRTALPAASTRVRAFNLPDGFALKNVLSNGIDTGGVFVPAAMGREQTLTAVITDKPASIAATVMREDKAVPNAHVILARWPMELVDDFPVYASVDCERDGTCAVNNVAPVEYRIAAVDEAAWERREMPGIAADWLNGGQRVTLLPGETRSLRLEVR